MFKTYKTTFLEAAQAHVHACHPHIWCWVPLGGDSPQRSWCVPALGKIGLKGKSHERINLYFQYFLCGFKICLLLAV